MILDIRCRVTVNKTADYFHSIMHTIGKLDNLNALKEKSLSIFFNEMENCGITTAVSVSGNNPGGKIGKFLQPDRTTSNDEMALLQKEHYGKILGVAGIDVSNTFHNAINEIERSFKLGLKIVFIEPGRAPGCLLSDKILYPIYKLCSELGITIIPQTSGLLGGKNFDYANPKYIEIVAEKFPNLKIICGHGCYPFVREMIMVCQRQENVWASPDLYLLNGLGKNDWIEAVNDNIFGFSDKFIFGSAYPFMAMEDAVNGYKNIKWKKEFESKIYYKNALVALNLENDPIFKQLYKL